MSRRSKAKVDDLPEGLDDSTLFTEELEGFLGYRLRRANAAMHRHFIAAVADLGLTQKQAAVLWLINTNPGAAQVSAADTLGMDRATTMAIVDRLDERGLLMRKQSTTDRRRQELYLTPAGQKVLRKAKARVARHEARFTSQFTASELEFLLEALRKLRDVA